MVSSGSSKKILAGIPASALNNNEELLQMLNQRPPSTQKGAVRISESAPSYELALMQ
jgi:hypothetical protein